jgi:hypothetical protein
MPDTATLATQTQMGAPIAGSSMLLNGSGWDLRLDSTLHRASRFATPAGSSTSATPPCVTR